MGYVHAVLPRERWHDWCIESTRRRRMRKYAKHLEDSFSVTFQFHLRTLCIQFAEKSNCVTWNLKQKRSNWKSCVCRPQLMMERWRENGKFVSEGRHSSSLLRWMKFGVPSQEFMATFNPFRTHSGNLLQFRLHNFLSATVHQHQKLDIIKFNFSDRNNFPYDRNRLEKRGEETLRCEKFSQ